MHKMKKLKLSKQTALCALVLLAVFVVLTVFESDYLFRVQELNLFLYTPLFFKQQLVVAGGLLTWLGTYFTQFFYYPWLGSLLLCLWLALMMWLMQRAFAVSRQWTFVLLVPVAMVLLTDFDLGYWVYYLKLRGHFFVAVIGVSMAVSLTWLYRVLAAKVKGNVSFALLLLFTIAAGLVAYPLGGYYGIIALGLMAVITWRIGELSRMQKSALTFMFLVMMWFIPSFYYRWVYYQTGSDYILWQALPIYHNTDEFSTMHLPYVVIFVMLFILAAFYRADIDLRKWVRPAWMVSVVPAILAVAALWSCWNWWYKDEAFHVEIRMDACMERCDWEGVLSEMRSYKDEPTRMMVMNKNLALFKLGRAGDEMYTYADGSKALDTSFEVRMAQLGGKRIYLHYGLPNYCYRWCLEDGVEYGWRAEYLKYMVRCALLNQEWTVARKYIDILKQTRYHRQWAEQFEPLAVAQSADAVAAHPELGSVLPLLTGKDVLGSDQSLIELFLLNMLAYRSTDNPKTSELVLLAAMQLKDIPTFWPAFFQYAQLHVGQPMPRHFQEAAYLYGHLENNVDISHMPFDELVKRDYAEFMQMAGQYRGMPEEQMKTYFRPRFGGTFYYNYFLMRGMKTY